MRKEKAERSADSEASSEARATLQARIETEVSELKGTIENELKKEKSERTEDTARIEAELYDMKAKIRQVASEHTVLLLSPKIVKQPHAVHMGESQMTDRSFNI